MIYSTAQMNPSEKLNTEKVKVYVGLPKTIGEEYAIVPLCSSEPRRRMRCSRKILGLERKATWIIYMIVKTQN